MRKQIWLYSLADLFSAHLLHLLLQAPGIERLYLRLRRTKQLNAHIGIR
jgi:hypothetical protein